MHIILCLEDLANSSMAFMPVATAHPEFTCGCTYLKITNSSAAAVYVM